MPRVKPLVNNQEKKIIAEKAGTICKYMMINGYDKQMIMDKLGIRSHNTINKRMKDGLWTGEQLAKLNVILRIPREERV